MRGGGALGVQRVTLAVALLGALLFFVSWVGEDLRLLESYGAGYGPRPHSGYEALFELLVLALPAGIALAVGWLITLLLRGERREPAVRGALLVTTLIGSAGAAVYAFEAVLDDRGQLARLRDQEAIAQAGRIAGDHDALARFIESHEVNRPLVSGGVTPLWAAVSHRFVDLVVDCLRRGAVPQEGDLEEAARGGDVAVVRALRAAEHHLSGRGALAVAFAAGATDVVDELAAEGLDVSGTLGVLLDPQKLELRAGEVDWKALEARWASSPPPGGMASALRGWGEAGLKGEEAVRLALRQLLASTELCVDPKLPPLTLEPWMRDPRLCTCTFCPYARQINWAILHGLCPDLVPPLERSQHVRMLRALARHVVRSGASQEPALTAAAGSLNLFLLELLEQEGFDVRALDGVFADDPSFNTIEGQRMRGHLQEKGVRWRD